VFFAFLRGGGTGMNVPDERRGKQVGNGPGARALVFILSMKKSLLFLLTALLLAGCARYDVTLRGGYRLVNVYHPKYDEKTDTYTIKSVTGLKSVIKRQRVLSIEPHQKEKFKGGMSESQFNPSK